MSDWFKNKPSQQAPVSPSLAPIGAWVRIPLPEMGEVIAFVYVDPEVGLSAKGGPNGSDVDKDGSVTVRYPVGTPWLPLDAEECRKLSLPAVPSWLHFYGPQPASNPPWRSDPQLRGRFLDAFPDDLQASIHDGEPRRTGKPPEDCWVRILGAEPGPARALIWSAEVTGMNQAEFAAHHRNSGQVYLARLLSAPHQLQSVKEGDTLRILAGAWKHPPLHVTTAYLSERGAWRIQPCNLCSLSECLDPPSTMSRFRFPNAEGEMRMFTSFCAFCEGTQLLSRIEAEPPASA